MLSKKTIASFDRLDGRLLSVQPVDKAEMVFRAGPMILVRSRGLLHAMKAGKFL